MDKKFITTFFFLFILILSLTSFNFISAQTNSNTPKNICATYFTGIGCPHCAKADPVVFRDLLSKNPELIIVEYEIYRSKENGPLLLEFNQNFNILPDTRLGIPFFILDKNNYLLGDEPVIKKSQTLIDSIKKASPCFLPNGSITQFDNLDFSNLPGKPKIWTKNRILIKEGKGGDNKILKELIENRDLNSVLKNVDFTKIDPIKVLISGNYITFDHAIQVDNWIFQWNGSPLSISPRQKEQNKLPSTQQNTNPNENKSPNQSFTMAKIASLASVDAINPCALAVLTLMLISILSYNPGKKKKVLMAGLSFVGAILLGYFVYGLMIIKFWQVAQFLTPIKLWLYKILGVIAIVLGILEIKDFIAYHPGGILTEMPLSMRPKAKKIISQITSSRGAFLIGIFVTLFLLPCTIGPYIIAGGILSKLNIIKIVPWLAVYDLIFVAPMVAIILSIYFGFRKINNISEWRERNIKYLHLISGIIIAILGVIMFLGLL